MKTPTRLMAGALATAILAGCANVDQKVSDRYRDDVVTKTEPMRQGPAERPRLTETSFAPALRCMDLMFITYGVRDLSVLVEDLPDPTRKVNAGGKDMIVSAVSQMSRRSRAIKLIAYSANDLTLGVLLEKKAQTIEELPNFAIRGSISQFDESIVRKQGEGSIAIGPLSGGAAAQAGTSMLGLDLNVIAVPSLVLIPGVTSKNSVLVTREGVGTDAGLELKKFGVNFNFSLARSEGTAQALRTLAELATIELFGKLSKVPYWTCLGADDKDPAVAAEIVDWWETLAADPTNLVAYLQNQMRTRGVYEGEVNGRVDDALMQSIGVYQKALGMPDSTELDFEFFRRYLAANHAEVQKKAQAMYAALPPSAKTPQPAAPASAPAPAPAPQASAAPASPGQAAAAAVAAGGAPMVLVQSTRGGTYVYKRGEPFQVDVLVDRDGFLYCYLLDENRKVNQFFPNPAQSNPAVRAGAKMSFPGSLPFRFVANSKGMTETVTCFGSAVALGPQPLAAVGTARDPDDLAAQFRRLAGPRVGMGRYDVKVQ
ncbi:MAG: DUF4384 domain-containing protein [Burkholderiales bacterium]|jgi:hypothetical protein